MGQQTVNSTTHSTAYSPPYTTVNLERPVFGKRVGNAHEHIDGSVSESYFKSLYPVLSCIHRPTYIHTYILTYIHRLYTYK
jgi:hypothetical protein